MKRFMLLIIKILIKPIDALISIFRKGHLKSIFLLLCKALESKTEYAAYQIKPKDTTEIPIISSLTRPHSLAIILQGPICTKDNMTINTVKYYKRVYPYAVIIVSTWENESKQVLDEIAKQGAVIVKSKLPESAGMFNVNYQLTNSLAGIRKAQEMGCEFSVKTRTDQRVCKPYIFDSMISAIRLFPSAGEQNRRIATLTVAGGAMFIPYHTSDFLYLGYTGDVLELFSAPLDLRKDVENRREVIAKYTRRQCAEQILGPEIYIMKHYCEDVLGLECNNTVADYWDIIRNYFICYGMKDIDLMWNKYDKLYDLNFYSSAYGGSADSSERLSTMCFDFFNWFNLYTGNIQYDKRYERYADVALINYEKKDY